MSYPGIGVMLKALFGAKQIDSILQKHIGKTISKAELFNDSLRLTFEDGARISIYDDGQSCCEHRYMVIDDDLSQFTGAKLLGVDVRDAPNIEDGYGEHEVQFLEVQTSLGVISAANHNEHNGYYGGFWLQVAELPGP